MMAYGITWEKCPGMNEDGKCKKNWGSKPGSHVTHKKHWFGGWYGMLSHTDPRDDGYGKNKPRPDGGKKKKKGVWHW